MKQRNTYRMAWVAACAVVWAAGGCSQSDDVPETPAARVPLAVASVGIQANVTVTKASAAVPSGKSIGVFFDNADGVTSYTPENNVRYDNDAVSGWKPNDNTIRLYLGDDNAKVCAYYPYSASVTDSKQVLLTPHVPADDETPLAYASGQTAHASAPAVSFTLKQAYAWLALTFERGDRADCTLKELTLANSGLSKEYLLDITTGNKTASTPATDGKVTFAGELALPRNGSVTRQVLLPPDASLPGGLKVSVKVATYNDQVISATLTGLTALEAGYKYAVTLQVTGTKLTATGVTVSDWAEVTMDNGGTGYVPGL